MDPHITEALSRLSERLRVVDQYGPMLQAVSTEFARIGEQLARVSDQVLRSISEPLEALAGYAQMAAPFVGELQLMADEIEGEEFESFEYNWLSSFPFREFWRLYRHHKEGRPEVAEASILATLQSSDAMDWLISNVESCRTLVPSSTILKDAIWAHTQQKYTLSVPAILPQIEGALRRRALELGVLVDLRMRRMPDGKLHKADVAYIVRKLCPARHRLKAFFVSFLTGKLFRERNPILHGNDPEYGTELMSAQCILAVNEIVAVCDRWSVEGS